MFTKSNFVRAAKGVGVESTGKTFVDLFQAYRSPTRFYHNTQHIKTLLQSFEGIKNKAKYPDEIRLAIWFHDFVYDTHASDNEEQSALAAKNFILDNGGNSQSAQRVSDMILATKTHEKGSIDSAMMLDLDLEVLGADPEAFETYDQNIRSEYQWVDEATYKTGRIAVLQSFLDRPTIYQTQAYKTKFEAQARANLEAKIAELS